MMNRTTLFLCTAALVATAACGHTEPGKVSAPAAQDGRAQEVRRDPLRRMDLMENMHRQIVYKTRTVPEDRYKRVVRPRLAMQLMEKGLDAGDAERVLRDVDYTRQLHQR